MSSKGKKNVKKAEVDFKGPAKVTITPEVKPEFKGSVQTTFQPEVTPKGQAPAELNKP